MKRGVTYPLLALLVAAVVLYAWRGCEQPRQAGSAVPAGLPTRR